MSVEALNRIAVGVGTVVKSPRFYVTPWVTVPLVAPFRLTLILAGGQVEKYPAVDPDPATEAVMYVVPGNTAVIWPVSLMVAIDGFCELYERFPVTIEQLGTVVELGPHSRVSVPFTL